MKRLSRGSALLGGLLGAALLLSACSATGSTPSSDSAGGTLVIDKSFDLKTADPARNFETTGNILGRALYDTLVTFENGDSSTPIPMVATEWSGNDDATEYTFTLRDDITFASGDKLTADDVVFSLERAKNVKGNGSFLMAGLTAEKVDDTTVVITSEAPNTAIPAIMTSPTLGILDSKVVEENGGSDAEGADTADTAEEYLNGASAGSGPYILDSFDITTETVITANPDYWGTKPKYDKVVLRNATAETQSSDVVSGTAQVALDLGSDQIASLEGNSAVVISTTSSPTIFFLFSNADPAVSTISSDPKFREAVTYGLDYDSLLELAGDGAIRAAGVVPDSFLGALKESDAIVRDVDRAKAAVAALGGTPTVSLEYPSDISSNGLDFGPIAERVQANLAEVGITVNLSPSPVATALENYRAGTEEMGLWLWSPDFPDPSDYLVFGPGATVGLRAGWAAGSAPEIEDIAAQAAVTVSDEERAPLYEEFQTKLNEAGVFNPLFQPSASVVASSAVGEVLYSPAFGLDIAAIGQ
ncbi:ABC transporter substrate-binding protein [Herbiconiux daphne]|uniref:ABC transporter substrate-binding protein n=1 Tax=Herbiconiux daphne TaxID=2970914 RepID=A0ABT2GY26_9MICO|nr:ABC transporter substrate-binding protein [Herbiconiux daphne]MCS5732222.1 ABC transporter substrate-binding protein [Herbiconiux daphne]